MIQTTSLALSKKILKAFPEWTDTEKSTHIPRVGGLQTDTIPLYDLGYLLRKLHRATIHHKWIDGESTYIARVSLGKAIAGSANTVIKWEADTPEEAAGLLVLELQTRELL